MKACERKERMAHLLVFNDSMFDAIHTQVLGADPSAHALRCEAARLGTFNNGNWQKTTLERMKVCYLRM